MNRFHSRFFRVLMLILAVSVLLSTAPGASAQSRQEQLDRKIAQIISQIPANADTDAEKALYLHDYIVTNVSYELVGDHQTAYGALLDGKAVCAGYADAYQRLLAAVGIRAYTIVGTADNGDGEPFPHAWTLLYLDGKCLYTDVTWDDPFVDGEQRDDNISYTYFQLSLEDISRDHFPDKASMALIPATCNHTGYDYYSVMQGEGNGCGIFNSKTSPEEAAKFFSYRGQVDGMDQFYCNFRFEGSGMLNWIAENWQGIASALGLTGVLRVSYSYSEHDAQVTISGSLKSGVSVTGVTLSPESLLLRNIGATAQLIAVVSPGNAANKSITFSSSDPSVATVSAGGLVTAVGNGTAVITVTTTDGGKTAKCNVTVSIPAEPEPTVTAPTEPSEPTPTTGTTEPPEVTDGPVIPEPSVTVPSVTGPSVPTAPAGTTEPPAVTVPTTQTTDPTVIPAVTAPTENTEKIPTKATETETQTPTEPQAPPEAEKKTDPVLLAVLLGGGVLALALAFLLLKRR